MWKCRMKTDFQKDILDDYDGDNSENITLTGSKLKNRSYSPLSKGNHLHNDCRNLEGWDIIAKKNKKNCQDASINDGDEEEEEEEEEEG